MITLKQILQKSKALKFIFERLEICSAIGREHLLEQKFLTSDIAISSEYQKISQLLEIISKPDSFTEVRKLKGKISEIRDISGSIAMLKAGNVVDDIQLFEAKRFAIIISEISEILKSLHISFINLPELQNAVSILDPDGQNIPHFYIYSSYSSRLLELRKEYDDLYAAGDINNAEKLRLLCTKEEDNIRIDLCNQLTKYAVPMQEALLSIANLDVLMAKAILAYNDNYIMPEISAETTYYKGLYNPEVKAELNCNNKEFQAVDISLEQAPCLITGANMSGKTVLLKTLELVQYLFQFGFFVPAEKAAIFPVDFVLTSFDDEERELPGLSSFAMEITNVNNIIIKAKEFKVLALIDELARTTNPDEGKAMVTACIEILQKSKTTSLITTHYSGINIPCRKLKVKGLKENFSDSEVCIENINNFIDYSLEEISEENVPTDALNIAKILGIDNSFIETAKRYLKK